MFEIIPVHANPRKRTRLRKKLRRGKHRVKKTRLRKNPIHSLAYYQGFNAYFKGYPLNATGVRKSDKHTNNPRWREGWLAAQRTKANTRMVANPRKKHETIIVGFAIRGKFYTRGGRRKTQRWYFTGDRFSLKREHAKIFSGDAAKLEAKRILNSVPYPIYAIQVEAA